MEEPNTKRFQPIARVFSSVRRRGLTFLDKVDHLLCVIGAAKRASFADLQARPERALYAGRLSRYLPQFAAHCFGVTPFFPSSRNISHDVRAPLPIPENFLDRYQAEDVFEHIPYDELVPIFDEIYRVLKPGGLFRFSVPDYGCDIYQERSVRDPYGNIVFDPGGGGAFRDGVVVDGGHLWFPTISQVRELFDRSLFGRAGSVEYMHYTEDDGAFVLRAIDFSKGFIQRVPPNDRRVTERPRPISIVVDAFKAI